MLTNKQRFSENTFHRFFRGRDSMKSNEENRCLVMKLPTGSHLIS